MVVMAIIGILAVLSVGSFRGSQQKARDAERKSDLKQIGISLEAYFNDKHQYPLSTANHTVQGCANETECPWGAQFLDENGTVYMVEIPEDPRSTLTYYYDSDGTYYQLYARLENTLDSEVPTAAGEPGNYGISCGDASCNYGISSANATIIQGRAVVAD